MTKHRLARRGTCRGSTQRFHGPQVESLEVRDMLAANLLASADASVASSFEAREIGMTVEGNSPITLMIETMAANGSGFDPAAVTIINSTGSASVFSMFNDVNGSTNGMTVAQFAPGESTFRRRNAPQLTRPSETESGYLSWADARDRPSTMLADLRASGTRMS